MVDYRCNSHTANEPRRTILQLNPYRPVLRTKLVAMNRCRGFAVSLAGAQPCGLGRLRLPIQLRRKLVVAFKPCVEFSDGDAVLTAIVAFYPRRSLARRGVWLIAPAGHSCFPANLAAQLCRLAPYCRVRAVQDVCDLHDRMGRPQPDEREDFLVCPEAHVSPRHALAAALIDRQIEAGPVSNFQQLASGGCQR